MDGAAAREILASLVTVRSDPWVRDRIMAEAHGSPLSLLELPENWLAGEWSAHGRNRAPRTVRKCSVETREINLSPALAAAVTG